MMRWRLDLRCTDLPPSIVSIRRRDGRPATRLVANAAAVDDDDDEVEDGDEEEEDDDGDDGTVVLMTRGFQQHDVSSDCHERRLLGGSLLGRL